MGVVGLEWVAVMVRGINSWKQLV